MVEKSGLLSSVPKVTKPAAFISSSTKLSEELLYTTVFTGSLFWVSVMSSPSSIDSPPSPASAMVCRSSNADCTPTLWDRALAMEPWLKDPMRRRLPFIVRYLAAQVTGDPDIRDEDRIVIGHLVDEPGEVLRVDGALRRCGEFVELLAGLRIVLGHRLEMRYCCGGP